MLPTVFLISSINAEVEHGAGALVKIQGCLFKDKHIPLLSTTMKNQKSEEMFQCFLL